jgi:CheY-like chemotaxis protein
VVEDDTDDSFLLTRQITAAQIEEIVTVVRTAEEALEFLQKQEAPPLVVFLDLRLPGISGIELLKTVRNDPNLKDIPVIVMTGHVDPKDVATCNELGVTAFLEKPVGLSTFIKSVAHLFPKHRGGEAE